MTTTMSRRLRAIALAAAAAASTSGWIAHAQQPAIVPTPEPQQAQTPTTQQGQAQQAAGAAPDAGQQLQQLNADTSTPVLRTGAKGVPVIRAQVLLDRTWFSVGEIDGQFGSNMKRAVTAFQKARGLQVNGTVDGPTWQALQQGQAAPVFGTYVLTQQDLAGPFTQIPDDPMDQAKLPAMGYRDPVEAMAERYHMSPKLLLELNRGRKPEAGQMIVLADTRPTQLQGKANSVRIDKSEKVLYVMGEGDRVLAAFPVSFGGQQDPLPVGQLKITTEAKDPTWSYDPALIRNSRPHHEKAKLPAGPNNPVGVMWLGLSKPHWGIHGTAEPSQMAKVATNGCVRLTNWDVLRLASVVDKGALVDVQS